MRSPSWLPFLMVLLLAALVAGCGDDAASSAGDEPATSTSLTHIDGTIDVGEDSFVLTPKNGGEAITFSYGPEVERAATRAIATAGTIARVTYQEDAEPVAALVVPAPELGEGLESYEGQITAVSDTEITIDGPDGERTFMIAADDAEAFDQPHLRDHQDAAEPVRVYFDPASPDAGIAYEDA